MPPKKKRKVKQKTKVSAKTKEVLNELGETTNGQDAKTAAMSLLGGWELLERSAAICSG